MFNWRNALVLTAFFVGAALIYFLGWSVLEPSLAVTDWTGFTLLALLGVSMGFGFIILLKSSREL